jgi:hypothetical protein
MAPKKSGQIIRLEPEGTELLEAYPQMAQKFKDAGWFNFFSTFQGHDEQISMAFAQNFDGFESVVGKLLMHVTEHSIAKACRLLVYGERWWKKENVVMEFVNQFLIPEKQNPNWNKGIPHRWVRKEWHTALLIIHRYITCEGRFSLVYLYHIRLLIHINGDYPLNLPYFLLKSLSKMSKRVQSHPATTKGSLFHQGLIRTLVVFSLNEVHKSWDWLIQSLKPDLQSTKSKTVKGKKPTKHKQTPQATEVFIKEESPETRVTRAGKRKMQTQQAIGDFPVGEDHEKGTTSRAKKPKTNEETDIYPDPDIKREIDEYEDFTTIPVQTPVKQKQQATGKKNAKGKKQSKKQTPVPKFPRRNSTRAANKFRLNSKAMFHPSIKKEYLIIIEDNSEDSKKGIKKQAMASSLHRT